MANKAVSVTLLVLTMAAVGTAIATLIPASALHKNDLSYFSWCPFAPWSTLILLLVAGVIWLVRGYLLSRAG